MMTILPADWLAKRIADWLANWPAFWMAPGTSWQVLLVVLIAVATCSVMLTRFVMRVMAKRRLTVGRNAQSSHHGSPLLGGGWSVTGLTLGFWGLWTIFFDGPQTGYQLMVLFTALGLGVISWLDDLREVPPLPRFIAQGVAVAACLFMLPGDDAILWHGFPLAIDRLLAGLFWMWFINLFNFMDGIDGMAASETIAVTLGITAVGLTIGLEPPWLVLAAMLGGAMAGFLPWNWHPSRILLGDLGAIPTGFLLGLLLIHLAILGQLVAALILPLYYLADASVTLTLRLYRGEPFWRPHRLHFYQRALAGEGRHDRIVMRIILANIVLVAAAVLSVSRPGLAIVLSLGVVALLLYGLHRLAGR